LVWDYSALLRSALQAIEAIEPPGRGGCFLATSNADGGLLFPSYEQCANQNLREGASPMGTSGGTALTARVKARAGRRRSDQEGRISLVANVEAGQTKLAEMIR
jgi:hypothetical protein